MANKIFSFYSNNGNHSATDGDQLIIEAGSTHFACLVKNAPANKITALEWFKHDRIDEKNLGSFFNDIAAGSVLVDKNYSQTKLFINNAHSVIIPPSRFDKNIMNDYLDTVLGKMLKSTSYFDEIVEGEGLVNAYRVQTEILDVLKESLTIEKVEHTYSQSLRRLFLQGNFPSELIKVQFYDSEIIVVVFKNSNLQFMQSFTYLSPEDVLYYLISLSQRLQLSTYNIMMKVSGMIDTHSSLYAQLVKYFRNVSTDTIEDGIVNFSTSEYPTHYFTPIYNLAL